MLLLAPKFYKYEEAICKELIRQGMECRWINCDPSPFYGNLIKAFGGFGVLQNWMISLFSKKKINEVGDIKERYDAILMICGWALNDEFVKKLKNKFLIDDGDMVLYYWDSRKNMTDDSKKVSYFDRVLSFDNKDCDDDKNLKFLPLFYIAEYDKLRAIKEKKYDLSVVASYNFFRYELLDNIKKSNNIKFFSFLFVDKKSIIFHKVFRKKCRKIDLKQLEYKPISAEKITDVYNDSVAVLDMPSPQQNGLSIRTLECLALGKKLVTTNKNVRMYDFYRLNNIFVLDESYKIPLDWLKKEYEPIDEKIIANYSIERWVKKVLNL